MKLTKRLAVLAALLLLGTGIATEVLAQRNTPWQRPNSGPGLTGGVPGRFDYYALVLSWSPTHCATTQRKDPADAQCNPRSGRRFSFVLHGLWPQHERGFPEFCPTAERPFVPQGTIDKMGDIMPSRGLIIHEYKKHGVCSGLSPDGYFDLSRRLFNKIKVPERYVEPTANQMVDTNAVIGEFITANPGLKPDMLAVSCGGPGNRLREVRVCFSREGEFRACGSNEDQRKLCNSPRVFVPPVRPGPAGVAPGNSSPGQNRGRATPPGTGGPMLPGPVAPGTRSL